MTIAVYPGSFDPVTNGHIDIATRASNIFEKVVVAVYDTPSKQLLFSTEERVSMMAEALKTLPNVEVQMYTGLTVDFAHQVGAKVLVRGLRVVSDFEWELQIALMNRKIAPDLDGVCLMTNLEYSYLSATTVKEVARLGGNVADLVPPHVARALRERFGSQDVAVAAVPTHLLRD
ncbi:MAG: pantetheine-phosphate adenylyltransferase [Chloroflexota bacterium]|nr:pantetheine-phosphate adenylyltransferase [Chloroflexota bacterium]